VLGAILIAVGILFFVGQQVDLDWGGEVWPFYIVGVGVVLAAFGLASVTGSGLTVAGSIVAMVGLILFYQEWADHYESWAYAWPLVAPGGSGVGMVLHGTRFANGKMVRDGMWQIVVALGILAVGFVFFEGLIGLSGDRWNLPGWAAPALLIGFGVLVLLRAVTSGRQAGEGPAGEPPPG
jgi:protein-S-isoprenylcysteine O-methyltransferase Ste14